MPTLNEILYETGKRICKSFIAVYKSAQQTLPKTTYAKITMGAISEKMGDAFELYDGGVRATREVYALLGGALYCNGGLTANDTVYIKLYVNNVAGSTIYTQKSVAGAQSFPIAPAIVHLGAGDIIHFYATNATAARGTLPAYYQNRMVLIEL